MKISIIGAGIGGLTTAIALQQKGFEVAIYESFQKPKRIGAGIVLANNAMQVYHRLGLTAQIYQQANPIKKLNVLDHQHRTLTSMDVERITSQTQIPYAAIHRGDLHKALLQQIPSKNLHLGKKLNVIEEQPQRVQLHFEDGSSAVTDLVIGADGIHSAVRAHLNPSAKIRTTQQVCWRGVAQLQLSSPYTDEVNEIWGPATRFGIVPLQSGEVYWFAVAKFKQDYRREAQAMKLSEIFADYPTVVNNILQHTPAENIILDELTDLQPLPTWHRGRICLIGDAAHATTPNMGQGAGQAIEDALALSICLAQTADSQLAFQQFQALRSKKVNTIVARSRQIGSLAHLEYAWARSIRNWLIGLTPTRLATQQTMDLLALNY